MKNFIRSKGFLLSLLAVACIGILVICFVVNRDTDNDFQPEEIASNTKTQEWQEAPTTSTNMESPAPTHTPAPAATKDPMEEYPKAVDESEDKVVIDFTPESEDFLRYRSGTVEVHVIVRLFVVDLPRAGPAQGDGLHLVEGG